MDELEQAISDLPNKDDIIKFGENLYESILRAEKDDPNNDLLIYRQIAQPFHIIYRRILRNSNGGDFKEIIHYFEQFDMNLIADVLDSKSLRNLLNAIKDHPYLLKIGKTLLSESNRIAYSGTKEQLCEELSKVSNKKDIARFGENLYQSIRRLKKKDPKNALIRYALIGKKFKLIHKNFKSIHSQLL